VHHGLTFLLVKKLRLKGYESGQYGSPPSITYWARQAAVYVFALTTMKMLVVALFAIWPGISKVGDWLLSWTLIGDGEAFQVILCVS
jgi:multidrug transporter EmrE-like cation transporter